MFLVKFGQTAYRDRETIGSGNDLIEGNTKTDLQMQFRIKFLKNNCRIFWKYLDVYFLSLLC